MIFRLTAGYREREAVKRLGARFNFEEKYWYYEGDSLPEGLRRWYPVPQTEAARMDLNVQGRQQPDFLVETQQPVYSGAEAQTPVLNGIQQNFMTVTKLNQMIMEKYSGIDAFQHVLVKGEVTNYRGHRGQHYYFDIKDDNAQISCRLWETVAADVLHFELERGQLVGISGCLEYYEKTGMSQLIVKNICNLGEGAAILAYMRLKERLTAEGLFAAEHKKEIPTHSKKVGIITSKNGDAIKDICQKAQERNPYVQLICYHVQVQGQNAVPSILRGIRVMDGMGCDVIIISRGGGTLEELMVYDDESIVRAVYAANTPIISAVGHQAHTPLLDEVADFRVSTPTSAADHVIPNVMADVERLLWLRREMGANVRSQLERRESALREKMAILERYHPERKLKEQKNRLAGAQEQLRRNLERVYQDKNQMLINSRELLGRNMERILQDRQLNLSRQREQLRWRFQKSFDEKKHRFELAVAQLHGLSPTAKLVKGFGYISINDHPVASVDGVKAGDGVRIRIHDGTIDARVTNVQQIEGRTGEE